MGGIIMENKEFAKRLSDKIAELIVSELEKENVKTDTRPITERVKTFEDACDVLGPEHPLVMSWFRFGCDSGPKDDNLNAYLKLRIICAALNEGWEPKFTKNEWRYTPWFNLFTDKEIADMDCGEARNMRLMRLSDRYQTEYAGFGYKHLIGTPSKKSAYIGSRLCLKSDELAIYCGKQFIDIWADYLLIRK